MHALSLQPPRSMGFGQLHSAQNATDGGQSQGVRTFSGDVREGNIVTVQNPNPKNLNPIEIGSGDGVYLKYEKELGISSQNTFYERAVAIKEALKSRNKFDSDIAIFDQLIEHERTARIYSVADNSYESGIEKLLPGQIDVFASTDPKFMDIAQRLIEKRLVLNDDRYDYQANLVFDEVLGTYIFGNRGTESIQDLFTDVGAGTGFETTQFNHARDNALILNKELDELVFTGHSLGGGQAALQSLLTGRKAITVNAMGLQDDLLNLYSVPQSNLNNVNSLISAVHVEGDFLTSLQQSSFADQIAFLSTSSTKTNLGVFNSAFEGSLSFDFKEGSFAEAQGRELSLPPANLANQPYGDFSIQTPFALHGRDYIHSSMDLYRQSLQNQLSRGK